MGRRSCSLRLESARGRVMMAPPIDVAGLHPRLGNVEAPPKPRSSPSSVAEVGSEPQVRARRRSSAGVGAESEPWGRAKRSSSSSRAEPKSELWVGRGGDCRLLGPSPSPSPGSSEAEIVVFWGRAQVRALGRARRRSSSSGAEPKSEPWVGRGGDRRLLGLGPSPSPGSGGVHRLPGLSPSPSPGSGGVRRLPGLSPSPSPGSGGVRCLPGLSPSPSHGSGGVRRLPGLSPSLSPGSGGVRRLPGLSRVRALGRAERSFLWCLWPGLTACQFHSVKWQRSRSGAGGAVLLSGRPAERRSDGGHFGSAGWGACVRIKVSGHLCIKCPYYLVGRCGDLVRFASWRRQGLGRAGNMFAAEGGPRVRRKSSGVGCPCPRLGSGEA
jgi:hypothetical protein